MYFLLRFNPFFVKSLVKNVYKRAQPKGGVMFQSFLH